MSDYTETIKSLNAALDALDNEARALLAQKKTAADGDNPTPMLIRFNELLGKAQQLLEQRNDAVKAEGALKRLEASAGEQLALYEEWAAVAELRYRAYALTGQLSELEAQVQAAAISSENSLNNAAFRLQRELGLDAETVENLLQAHQERIEQEIKPRLAASNGPRINPIPGWMEKHHDH